MCSVLVKDPGKPRNQVLPEVTPMEEALQALRERFESSDVIQNFRSQGIDVEPLWIDYQLKELPKYIHRDNDNRGTAR